MKYGKAMSWTRVAMIMGAVVVVGIAALLLMPSPIDSVAWEPAPAPQLVGPLMPNEKLQEAELIAQGKIVGPEDLAFDANERMYTGLEDGRIVRIDGPSIETVLKNTGGRPLGIQFDAKGNLIVCDAWKGLLCIAPNGKVDVLANAADGIPFGCTDNLDIASDGKIYFSDASSKWHLPDYMLDFLEGRPYGRLLVYDPVTKQTTTLIKGLYFANGVALSKNEDFVLVAETYRARIQRYWLKGPKPGTADVFADNLPGLPDNIDSDRQGRFWVAMVAIRKADTDMVVRHPWLKELVAKLPGAMRPKAPRYSLAIALDESGRIVTSLHDTTGKHLSLITTVLPHRGALYFGSHENDRIGRLVLGQR
jgi:sugar lactone lactonase YvrE